MITTCQPPPYLALRRFRASVSSQGHPRHASVPASLVNTPLIFAPTWPVSGFGNGLNSLEVPRA